MSGILVHDPDNTASYARALYALIDIQHNDIRTAALAVLNNPFSCSPNHTIAVREPHNFIAFIIAELDRHGALPPGVSVPRGADNNRFHLIMNEEYGTIVDLVDEYRTAETLAHINDAIFILAQMTWQRADQRPGPGLDAVEFPGFQPPFMRISDDDNDNDAVIIDAYRPSLRNHLAERPGVRAKMECLLCSHELLVPELLPEGARNNDRNPGKEPAVTLPACQHIIGSVCLYQWGQRNPSCPVCRTELPYLWRAP